MRTIVKRDIKLLDRDTVTTSELEYRFGICYKIFSLVRQALCSNI